MHAAQEITMKQLSRRLPVLESDDELATWRLVLNQMIGDWMSHSRTHAIYRRRIA